MHVAGAIEQGFIAHADGVHDQRIALPGSNRVSVPGELKRISLRMLSAVREDLAHLRVFLINHPYLSRYLEYLDGSAQPSGSGRETVAAGIQFVANAWRRLTVIVEKERIHIVLQSLRGPLR